jgi:oxygen-dependent protoporphyrinogen oxidase
VVSTDVDVAVVGAGIAGLTAAYELRKAGVAVRVFEAAKHVGGRMASIRLGGYTIDAGAEQVPSRGYRATWELVRELGIPPDEVPLIGSAIGMWRDGAAHPGVSDPLGLLTGAGLSPRARLDLARFQVWASARRRDFDTDHPEATPLRDRTLAEWLRRYHPDLHDYLLQPVAAGFFGWDTGRSAAAPLLALMLEVGPVTGWRTYRSGMDTLARALAERVDVVLGTEVHEVVAGPGTARLTTNGGTATARSVLLCVPAPVAARIHANPHAEERAFLDACTFTPMLKVSCLLDRPLAPTCARELYALLTPRAEDPVLAGLIVDHVKHPGRVPPGRGLVSLIAQPEATGELLAAPEADIVRGLTEPAERYLPGLGAATTATLVHRFRHGLPEATPRALRSRADFAARPVSAVDYAGDWITLRPSSEGAVRAAATAVSRTLSRKPAGIPRLEVR